MAPVGPSLTMVDPTVVDVIDVDPDAVSSAREVLCAAPRRSPLSALRDEGALL